MIIKGFVIKCRDIFKWASKLGLFGVTITLLLKSQKQSLRQCPPPPFCYGSRTLKNLSAFIQLWVPTMTQGVSLTCLYKLRNPLSTVRNRSETKLKAKSRRKRSFKSFLENDFQTESLLLIAWKRVKEHSWRWLNHLCALSHREGLNTTRLVREAGGGAGNT